MQHVIGKVRRRRRRTSALGTALARGGGRDTIRRVLRGLQLQAKLKVGAPNDAHEQEADRVAERVMAMPEAASGEKAASSGIQRKCAACQDETLQRQPQEEEEELQAKRRDSSPVPAVGPGLESQIRNMQGGGRPLPADDRRFFEPRFGREFSDVRIHTDNRAAGLARSIDARAFTLGSDVVFGQGEYQPGTDSGRRLMAHELTHVIQQSGRGTPDGDRAGPGSTTQKTGATLQRAGDETEGSGAETPFVKPSSDRHNYAFIMGTTGSYRIGAWFAQAYYSGSHQISHAESLCAVLERIAGSSGSEVQPDGTTVRGVGQVVIISHANADGRFYFPVNSSDTDKWVTPGEISTLLSQKWLETASLGCRQAALSVAQSSDAGTRVIIKGCNLGRNQEAVDALRHLFGSEATVTAPKQTVNMRNESFGPRVAGRRTISEAISWMVTNGFLPPEANAWSEERKTGYIDALFSENARDAGMVGIPAEYLLIEGRRVSPSDPEFQENIAVSKPEAPASE